MLNTFSRLRFSPHFLCFSWQRAHSPLLREYEDDDGMDRDETERNGEEQERETLQTGEELRALKLSRWIFKPRALARSVRFPLSCRWWRPGGGDQTNGQATSNGQLLLQVVRASPFVGLGGLQRSCGFRFVGLLFLPCFVTIFVNYCSEEVDRFCEFREFATRARSGSCPAESLKHFWTRKSPTSVKNETDSAELRSIVGV